MAGNVPELEQIAGNEAALREREQVVFVAQVSFELRIEHDSPEYVPLDDLAIFRNGVDHVVVVKLRMTFGGVLPARCDEIEVKALVARLAVGDARPELPRAQGKDALALLHGRDVEPDQPAFEVGGIDLAAAMLRRRDDRHQQQQSADPSACFHGAGIIAAAVVHYPVLSRVATFVPSPDVMLLGSLSSDEAIR